MHRGSPKVSVSFIYIYIYIYMYTNTHTHTLQMDLLLVQVIRNRIYFFLLQVSSKLILRTVGDGEDVKVS
jgi:hypothetical protein